MGLLDRVRRVFTSGADDVPSPDEAERLRGEVVRLYQEGRYRESAEIGERLLALQKQVLGEHHPDYATGLSNLAILLRKAGNDTRAEELLQQASAIRQEAVSVPSGPEEVPATPVPGSAEPEAPSTAEPDASQQAQTATVAAEESAETPPAPAVVAAEEFAETPPAPVVVAAEEPAEAPPAPAMVAAPAEDSRLLAGALAELTAANPVLGAQAIHAAERLRDAGEPFPEDLLERLDAQRRDVAALRVRIDNLAGSLGLASPGTEATSGSAALASWLEAITAEEENYRLARESIRRRAVAVLDRMLALSHADGDASEPWRDCQKQAQALRDAIPTSLADDPPYDAVRLSEGSHPFVDFLTFVDGRETLSDESWGELHETVRSTLGRSLAAAAARGKIRGSVAAAQDAPPS